MAGAVSCPRCNKRLPGGANFCRRCGMGLAGRSAAPLPPPLISTGYEDPAAAGWRGSPAGDSAVLGYEARGTRRPRPEPVPPPPRAAFSVRGWWLFILLGIFAFRACATHTSHKWDSPRYRPPPTIRSAPRHDQAPPAREENTPWPTRDDHGNDPY